ncbi:ice-binding family protein [Mucilaginibacter sp.]|uniref:ice-binding family protein n=1 Tax=Mucilaginibacter sp. TaxID=1882438 RepID=UPI003D0EF11B
MFEPALSGTCNILRSKLLFRNYTINAINTYGPSFFKNNKFKTAVIFNICLFVSFNLSAFASFAKKIKPKVAWYGATAPNLGSIAGFALFTTVGAVGNTGVSNITGSIGTGTGAVSGYGAPSSSGPTYINDSQTTQATQDLTNAYNQLTAATVTAAHGAVLGNGETIYAGVYSIAGAGSAAGTLTLDAQGNANAVFIFKVGGAFTTGAATTVVLTNGALASNIFWVAEGAVAMAAATTMKGTLISNNGAISMGDGGSLEGRMLSTTGAVSTYGDNIYIPVSGFSWVGVTSTDWNTASNWLNGIVPTSIDNALIGVSRAFTYFPNVLASSGTTNVGSIAFGNMGGQAAGVVVNSGSTLTVIGAITYQGDSNSNLGYVSTLSGMGILNANSLNVIAGNSLATSNTDVFASSVNNLNITTNIALTSSNNGTTLYNVKFNLTGGIAALTGLIQTTNTSSSTSSFIIIPSTSATLQLIDTAALSGLSNLGANIVTFNNTGSTVEYSGASQIVYTDAGIMGLSSGVSYQNIKFSGIGIKTASTGNLNNAGDYTTTLANDAADYVNLSGPAVNFNGTTQSLAGGAGNGTVLYNVNFSGAGTKTMVSGNFYVANSGILTMVGSNTNTTLATGGFLTLRSGASQSATIAAILPGPSITGIVNVERFLTGTNSNYRGYRLLTSPVNSTSPTSGPNNYLNLYYFNKSTNSTAPFTAGPGAGFTIVFVNPSMYLLDEQLPNSNSGFTSGKNVGIKSIGTVSTDYTIGTASTSASSSIVPSTASIPAGNGFLLFFIGSNNNRTSGSTSIAITDATITNVGYLNQQAVTVNLWYPGSGGQSHLSYTSSLSATDFPGFNMVGNPYASTIDLKKVWADNSSNNIGQVFYELDNLKPNNNYVSYNGASGATSGSPATAVSQYIASGQGFLVTATSATNSTLTFQETEKAAAGVFPGQLLLVSPSGHVLALNTAVVGLPAKNYVSLINTASGPLTGLHLRLQQDSVTFDECGIYFRSDWSDKFDVADGRDLDGVSPSVFLSSYTSDNVRTSINSMAQYTGGKNVKLFVKANKTGNYLLTLEDVANIDTSLFNIFILDHLYKDSLDVGRYKSYVFTIITSDTTTYGANRFELAVERKAVIPYQLMSFIATKVSSGILLSWKTNNESNYTGFGIEKQAINGKQYDIQYQVQSNGSGNYTYLDHNPVSGANTYRLTQNNISDVISYSSPVSIFYNPAAIAGQLTVFPNPCVKSITVNMNSSSSVVATSYNTFIYDMLGVLVVNQTQKSNSWTQDVSKLKPGAYVIKIKNTSGDFVGDAKFVKIQ